MDINKQIQSYRSKCKLLGLEPVNINIVDNKTMALLPNNNEIDRVYIPEFVYGILTCGFALCDSLAEIDIPSNIKIIDQWAFKDCMSLHTVNIQEGLESIEDGAFSKCLELKNISLPDSLTSIGSGIFNSCVELKSIELPKNITVIPEGAFSKCVSLDRVITKTDKKITLYASAFSECENVELIYNGDIEVIQTENSYVNYEKSHTGTQKILRINVE